MSSHTPPATLPYAASRPLRERVNWRLVVFLAVVATPFLYFFYVLVSQAVTGGVVNRGGYSEVDLKALGNFSFDQTDGKVSDVPKRYRDLDGKRVELKGFMYNPTSAGDTATELQFVYNVTKCCFNGPPLVQERVYGRVANGRVTLYDQYTFARVVGTLHVRVQRDEAGAIHSVYDMDIETAEQVKG